MIDGTLGWAVMELRELTPGGDHTIAIGEVVSLGLGGGEPLMWFEGGYRDLAPVAP